MLYSFIAPIRRIGLVHVKQCVFVEREVVCHCEENTKLSSSWKHMMSHGNWAMILFIRGRQYWFQSRYRWSKDPNTWFHM